MNIPVKFCSRCGLELKTTIIEERGFDSNTGEKLQEVEYECPNYRKTITFFGTIFGEQTGNGHSKFKDALNFKYTYNSLF